MEAYDDMKLLKTGIGVTLMSILALNVNGDNVALAQDDDDDSENSEVELQEDISVDEVIENGYAAQEEIETLYLETMIRVSYEDQEDESVTREWFKQDGDVTLSRTEIENADGQVTTVVNNGSEVLTYTEGEDVAYRTDLSEIVVEFEGEEEGVASNQVFTVSAYLESLQEIFDVSVDGTDEVNDRDAYKLTLEPTEGSEYAQISTPSEMWVDAEYFVILKQYMEDEESDSEVTSEFVEMEVNADIEDSIFELELSEDVEIVDNMGDIENPDADGEITDEDVGEDDADRGNSDESTEEDTDEDSDE